MLFSSKAALQRVAPALLTLVLLGACSNQPPSVSPPGTDGPTRDTTGDRGVPRPIDTCDPVDASSCRFSPELDLFALAEDPAFEIQHVSVAGLNGNFAATYVARDEAGARQVWLARFGRDGRVNKRAVTSGVFVHKDPVVSPLPVGWLLAYGANYEGNLDLYARAFDGEGNPAGMPHRVSVAPDTVADLSPSLAVLGDSAVVAWVRTSPGYRGGSLRSLSLDGTPTGEVLNFGAGNDDIVTLPSLIRTQAQGSSNGLLLGWANSYGPAFTAVAARVSLPLSALSVSAISESGASLGDSRVQGSFDVALDGREGVAVYGVVRDNERLIRGRRLMPSGEVSSLSPREYTLDVQDETAWDVSVARFGGGYVVAYRSLARNSRVPMLRLAFMQSNFHSVRVMDLGPTTDSGGQVRVRVSGGVLGVAWAEGSSDEGLRLRAARVICDQAATDEGAE